jgi:hypothetical protein
MHKNTTKCNKTQSKWCINKHGASKIIDTFETYQQAHPCCGETRVARPIVGEMERVGESLSHVLTGEDVWGYKWLYFFQHPQKKVIQFESSKFWRGWCPSPYIHIAVKITKYFKLRYCTLQVHIIEYIYIFF